LSEARNEHGPPILSKIPYISRLFRNIGYGREAQSLMIMVTPRIIINEEEELIHLGELPVIPRP
jgi:general secretion pathway protein D